MVTKLIARAGQGAATFGKRAQSSFTPDLQTYAGGTMVSVGLGLTSLTVGLVCGGLWLAATGMLRDIAAARKAPANR